MTGILLAAVVGLWLWVCVRVTRPFFSSEQIRPWRGLMGVVLLVVLLVLPLADELVGKQQFEKLCNANGIEGANISEAKGRRVKVGYGERRPVEEGTVLSVLQSEVAYRDSVTD